MKTQQIPVGYCQCGCGEKTALASQTRTDIGRVRDEPVRFIRGHHAGLWKEEKHPQWKGDAVGYKGLHAWLLRHFPKLGYCAFCKRVGKTEFANISGEYKRDIEDFVELCRSCHDKFDA